MREISFVISSLAIRQKKLSNNLTFLTNDSPAPTPAQGAPQGTTAAAAEKVYNHNPGTAGRDVAPCFAGLDAV